MMVKTSGDGYRDEYILEHLTVDNGRPMYIDEDNQSRPSKRNTNKKPKEKPKPASDDNTYDVKSSGHYEEHYETHEEYCIHMGHLTNQGVTMCDIGQDITMCASCPYRKPRTVRVKVSSVSIDLNK